MAKNMYRVYAKQGKAKWYLVAAFMWKTDALNFVNEKFDPKLETSYKVMLAYRNVQTFYVDE